MIPPDPKAPKKAMMVANAPTSPFPTLPRRFASGGEVTPQPNTMGLYSQGAVAAKALPQFKGTPQQMVASLKAVKPEEVRWSGADKAFAGKPIVDKHELAEHFQKNMPPLQDRALQRPRLSVVPNHEETEHAGSPMVDVVNQHGRTHFTGAPEDAEQYMQEGVGGDNQPKFEKYTLPSGENYREVLTKLPPEKKVMAEYKVMRPDGHVYGTYDTADNAASVRAAINGTVAPPTSTNIETGFKSQHWPDLNVVLHRRLADRNGTDGSKILHLEELQSDWGQKGRSEGFKHSEEEREAAKQNMIAKHGEYMLAHSRALKRRDETGSDPKNDSDLLKASADFDASKEALRKIAGGKVPQGPYVGNTQSWTDLGLKKTLHDAAKGGYDKLAWTPGQMQADRYDLSKQISKIEYEPDENGTYEVIAHDHNGRKVLEESDIPKDKLHTYVGKELADKIDKGHGEHTGGAYRGWKTLSGLDLKVGGEGMKGYYDNILPKRLMALAKEHDPEASLGHVETVADKDGWHITPPSATVKGKWMVKSSDYNSKGLHFDTEEEAKKALTDKQAKAILPALTITPKMRESILRRGFKAYARGGSIAKTKSQSSIVEHALQLTNPVLRHNAAV